MAEIKNSNITSEPTDNSHEHKVKVGFFRSLFESIFKNSTPEAIRRRKLKNIAKTISKSKFHNFYKPGSSEMLAGFGKLMFELYKVVAPAQKVLKNDQNQTFFKRQIINYILSERQLELVDKLDERKILELSKKVELKKLKYGVEQILQAFVNEFDGERAKKAANLSRAFTIFKDFCCFDFYLTIKKYDSSYREYSFDAVPKLDKINSEYVGDDLKDFLTVAYAITDDSILWDDLFEMLKKAIGKDLVSPDVWKKIISKLKIIQASHILDLIIKHMTQDLDYETKVRSSIPSVMEPYIDKIENDTRELLNKIQCEQKESKANNICMQIFGTVAPQSMKYYTSSLNSILDKKDLTPIEYAEPINYLKTFLIEFVKKNVREYYEVIVIRGQWDASMSAPMSNAYQELLKLSDKITTFDENFSEEGPMGSKLRTLLPKTAHDAGAENIINRVIGDANDIAHECIVQSTKNLITIGKIVKRLVEDYSALKPTIVRNWHELEKYIESPMKPFCIDIYKKIYLFVQLMQTYVGN